MWLDTPCLTGDILPLVGKVAICSAPALCACEVCEAFPTTYFTAIGQAGKCVEGLYFPVNLLSW